MTRQSLTVVSVLLPFLGALSACRGDYKLAEVPSEPLTVTVLTPTYGAYLGSHSGSPAPDVAVTGVVTPADAQVLVNGVHATVDAEGNFSATVPWALDSDPNDRAFVLDGRPGTPMSPRASWCPCLTDSTPGTPIPARSTAC